MPLPPLDLIRQIGCRIRTEGLYMGIDALLEEALEIELQAPSSEAIGTDFAEFRKHLKDIAWETEIWVADVPEHLIHFNGDRFLGPR